MAHRPRGYWIRSHCLRLRAAATSAAAGRYLELRGLLILGKYLHTAPQNPTIAAVFLDTNVALATAWPLQWLLSDAR
jgi:hypothetical protein